MLRFHHVLIRDAAYRRLLKGTRAELHEQLADWIEAQGGDAPEHDEIIGRHLEQAHQLRRELGPLDANGDRHWVNPDYGLRQQPSRRPSPPRHRARQDESLADVWAVAILDESPAVACRSRS